MPFKRGVDSTGTLVLLADIILSTTNTASVLVHPSHQDVPALPDLVFTI